MSYASLHVHTEYSNLRLLDSTNKLEATIDKSVELGLKGLAITDHESLSGHIKAMDYVRSRKKSGAIPEDFKLILGDEIYLIDSLEECQNNYISGKTKYYHFILLAKDKEGYKQLRQISSQAWKNRFVQFKQERVPIEKQQLEAIVGDNKGHLIASTACLGGELADIILHDKFNAFYPFVDWCKSVFDADNFYMEMQPNDSEDQEKVNKAIVKLSEQSGIPFIITTDAHYLTAEYREIHEAYLKSRENDDREVADFYKTTYLMDEAEIHQWMDDQIGKANVDTALANSLKIADMVDEFDMYHNQVVPKVDIPEFCLMHLWEEFYDKYPYLKKFAYSEDEHDRYYLYLVEKGFIEKEPSTMSDEEYEKHVSRINEELEAIWESSIKIGDKISNYYITYLAIKAMVWDDNGGNSIVGVSRGSVAAFYTCYLTGVQDLNSYSLNIPSFRHLHADRPEMPDVDFDSESRQRGRILQATKNRFGEDKVLNICTFKTEGSRSAILTVCRGLGLDNETASYLSMMIPTKRGATASLKEMLYGDEDTGTKPDTQFINECIAQNDKLLEYAQQIEGLISGRSIHASGVIIFETPYTDLNCMMTAPNGQAITQWDMNDSTYCGGLKYDYLTVSNLDTMHICLDFLVEHGYIEWQGSLKATFNKYFSPDVIDYSDMKMWEKAWNSEVLHLFQFDTPVGGQVIKKTKPTNLLELGVANALERLIAPDGEEQPVDKYVRYYNDENQWYDCMRKQYHLTDDEVATIEYYLKDVHGVATMQEEVMLLSMDKNISNFSMVASNKLRKGIAKKSRKLQDQAKKMFYDKGLENGTSLNMLNYVWEQCITPQLSYSFSLPHLDAYSIIAVQELNMACKYPIIYWNTANLIGDSASDEENTGDSTDYGAIGKAIANIQSHGLNVDPPYINEAEFGFKPDEANNRIIFGLKGIKGVGDDAAQLLIKHRPYTSMDDFYTRMIDTKLIKNSEMLALIKAGVFSEFQFASESMNRFVEYLVPSKESLTTREISKLVEWGIIPENSEQYIWYRNKNFAEHVLSDNFLVEEVVVEGKKIPKCGYHDRLFKLSPQAQEWFKVYYSEDSVVRIEKTAYVISEKKFLKECENKYVNKLRTFINQKEVVDAYNQMMFDLKYNDIASGNESTWEMEALTYYYSEHELAHTNLDNYGVVDFSEQPQEPVAYDHYPRWIKNPKTGEKEKKWQPKYTIQRIAGTVIDKNKDKHVVFLLTPTGLVQVKLNKGEFLFYNKTISETGEDGKKHTLEKSWFERGNKLLISGYRQDDIWRGYKYSDSIYSHVVNKVTEICEDGSLIVQQERIKV